MHAPASPRSFARIATAASVALLLAACEHRPSAPGALASISVTRNPDTLTVTSLRQFTAIGYDADGSVVGINPVWSVAASGGAISSSGVFTAGTLPGTFTNTVMATVGSISGTATLTVVSGPAASIIVTPNPDTLAVGASQQFTAVIKDASGNILTTSPNWSVAAGGGTINSAGLFTAGTVAGTFSNTVTASVGTIAGFASVTVSPGALASMTVTPNPKALAVSAKQQFTATGLDAHGNLVSFTPTWSVQSGGGTIDNAGLFTAGGVAGTFTNTVRACSTVACASGSISGAATVTVTPGALASITVTPNPVTVGTNATQQFTAVGRDASGNVLSILPAPSWSVVAGHAGGTISGSGLYTAPSAAGVGFDSVRATSGSISGSARANVQGTQSLVAIVVTPDPAGVAPGATVQFTATGFDASGRVVPTPGLTWSVVAGGGTIGAGSGLFTAGSVAGTFPNTVRAASGSVAGNATVIVTTASAGPLVAIVVAPNPANVLTGAAVQFTATGFDATGRVVPTPGLAWSVVAGGGTIAGGSGLFTAGTTAGTFANTVRATSGSISGNATVIVTAAPAGALVTIVVTPNPASIIINGNAQFTATGFDGTGRVVPTPGLTWSVVAGGGTINAGSGLFTAGATAGSFPNTVRATSGGVTGNATVNVIVAPAGALVTIVVAPNPASVIVNGNAQFTATGYDASGRVVPTPGLSWSIAAGGGTINSSSGLFTAGSVAGSFPNTVRATSGATSGFATVNVTPAPPSGPSLGAAATHGILAGSAVTCASAPGTVNADVSVWPGSAITGFPPCTITGARHAADPFAQTAQGDLTTAYLALAAMPCGTTVIADLGGTTLAPGVYCSTAAVGVTGVVTLSGPADAIFVIRAQSTLITAGSVVLSGGAQAKNVFWWVGSSATLGTGSSWKGNIVAFTSITLVDNVTLVGRALARNGAVTMGTNGVIILP